MVVNNLSVESLSLSRTEALCGYPFDITTPGTEEQDERLLYEHRDSLTDVARASAISLDKLPDADKHRAIVEDLRRKSAPYYDLQQIVRLLVLFREWREIEETLIKYDYAPSKTFPSYTTTPNRPTNTQPPFRIRNDRTKDGATARKPDTQRTKQILEAITAIFDNLMHSLSSSSSSSSSSHTPDATNLRCAYLPDILLAYLSVLQTSSFFLQRDPAIKAMEVAVLVADEDGKALQEVLLATGRMSELVDCLACVGKAMLRLGEYEKKGSGERVKRGGKGETLRIWDLGGRERV